MKGNAECLPVEDSTYDVYTIAFGIRNCTHIDTVSIAIVYPLLTLNSFNRRFISIKLPLQLR